MDYLGVLQRLHEIVNPDVYLEIGVQHGRSLALSRSKSIGVDPALSTGASVIAGKPWLKLYQTTSDDFFALAAREAILEGGRLEFAFIDGLHLFEQVLRDFIHVERWAAPGSIIVLHDVIPPDIASTGRTPHGGIWVGDVWKMVPCLQRRRPDLTIDVIDTDPSGLLVIRNPDPANTVLTDRYDAIVAEFVNDAGDASEAVTAYLAGLQSVDPDGFLEDFALDCQRRANTMGSARHLYLDLLRKSLTRYQFDVDLASFDPASRIEGRDRPLHAETTIGLRRLENIENCITDVLSQGVAGDLLEIGAGSGGAAIFMRAALKAYGISDRNVWIADDFADASTCDSGENENKEGKHGQEQTPVPLQAVKAAFARYGLLDDRVLFIDGAVPESRFAAPLARLALLRITRGSYAATTEALQAHYSRLSIGGYAIIDDYGAIPGCQRATDEFRAERGIHEPIQRIDWSGVFWQRRQ